MSDEKYLPLAATACALLVLPWLNPVTYGPTHAVVQFLTVWVGGALFWLVCEQARLEPATRIRVLAAAWLLAACASAAMGLLQYLGFAEFFAPWLNYVEPGQAYANLRQRNQQATLLAIGLSALPWWRARSLAPAAAPTPAPSALVLAPQPAAGASDSRAAQLTLILATVLLATAAAASGSRTGMLQLLVLLGLALLWQRARATLLLALISYGVAAVGLPQLAGLDPLHSGILGRLAETPSPCASRLTLWSNVLHLIAQKPWTGWGWGELDYAHFVTLYAGPRFCEILGNAHNLPLHLAVELGLPAALLVCAAALYVVLKTKPWREADATRQMAWSVLAVIGAHSLLEYPLWYAPFQLAALLACGLLWQTRPTAQAQPNRHSSTSGPAGSAKPNTAARRRWFSALACAVLLACTYTAWDYWRISQIYLPVAQRDAAYRDNTLEKIRPSRLFADQVKFAELGITPLTAENAAHIHALALEMLHFSPEASVVGKVIESAELLGLSEEAQGFKVRFEAAYPQEYASWLANQKDSGASHKTP